MNNAIETHKLTRLYRKHEALHELNLTIPSGSAYALLGRNGAGKTTTVKLIAGLLRPTAGESSIFGQSSMALRPEDWQRIGYVSENQALYDWMTGEEQVRFTAALYPQWDPAFAAMLCKKLDLPLARPISGYSRGQKIKLALLMALAYRPRLLILDEPFSGLDPLVREEFLSSLLEITSENEWTIFFATNDIDDVEKLADQVGIIEEGRLQISEPLDALQRRFRSVQILGTEALTKWKPANAIAIEEDAFCRRYVHTAFSREEEEAIHREAGSASVEIHPMSLKEIFLSLAKSYREKGVRQ